MTLRIAAVGAAAALVGVLLAGCGEKDSPPPGPTTRTVATTSASAAPAELASFVASPCSVLTDAQRTALDKNGFTVRAGTVKAHAQSPTCQYGDLQHRETGTLWVTAFVVTDAGLAELTADHAKGLSPEYWKQGTLASHPVLYYTGQGSPEFCSVAIGFTDRSYVGVEVTKFNTDKPREDTCKSTTAVAEQVLATITGSE
ncbi:DUF3558 family protein [Labedaea rhizosphaerae]|uniref:Uncharacterized protein DUF3558 n=1 Tax=Labedaea rhizosphaerae TaxID=598644 RepID=A0A4R6S5M2_LABRH|nr:DUF3558 family protein [Labedaea rhizosphaerae]TDP95062.1 uncharacterized protein DUF3558 [Labedaea rhizosphaerae]